MHTYLVLTESSLFNYYPHVVVVYPLSFSSAVSCSPSNQNLLPQNNPTQTLGGLLLQAQLQQVLQPLRQ